MMNELMCKSEVENLFYVQRGFHNIKDLSLCFNRLRSLFDCYRICCHRSFLGVTEKAGCSHNSLALVLGLFYVQIPQLNVCK